MSDLLSAVKQSLVELQQARSGLGEAQTRAVEAREGLSQVVTRLEAATTPLFPRAQTCAEQIQTATRDLAAEFEQLSTGYAAAATQVRARESAMAAERVALLQELGELEGELQDLEAQLAATRQEAEKKMASCSDETRAALAALAAEMGGLERWTVDELTPMLRVTRTRVEERAELLRRQILEQTLPEITVEYVAMQQHLRDLAVGLSDSLEFNAQDTWDRAWAALDELTQTCTTLCARSAEETRKVCQALNPEEQHIRARAEDLVKQAKTYAELGTPAAVHLGVLVGIAHYLEELLVEAKALTPRSQQ